MTGPVIVMYGNTEKVLETFYPGTPEADLWETLVTPRINGRLRDSAGKLVTRSSKRGPHGPCVFYADTAGKQALATV